jgi:hypothetical protein
VDLPKISLLEETSTNVEDWQDEVYCVLRLLHLHKLLDHNRPQPMNGNKGYEQWSYWSNTVMYANVLMKELARALRGSNVISQTILDGKRFIPLKETVSAP